MPAQRTSRADRLTPYLRGFAINVIPPAITLLALLLIWQLMCDRPGATLPAPTIVWAEAKDLILEPFLISARKTSALAGACWCRWSAC